MEPQKLLVFVPIVFSFIPIGLSFFVTVEPHVEECFFEKVQQGSKMSLMFEVIEGGFLDIDVQVRVLTHHLVYCSTNISRYVFNSCSGQVKLSNLENLKSFVHS